MSNRRRRQAPLTWDEWSIHAQMAALELLAAAGCGESGSDSDGVHVHVLVSCEDPDCVECGTVRGRPQGGLPPEDGSDVMHPGCRACWGASVG